MEVLRRAQRSCASLILSCQFHRDVAFCHRKHMFMLIVSSIGHDLAPIAEEGEWRCVARTVMRHPGSLAAEHLCVVSPTHRYSGRSSGELYSVLFFSRPVPHFVPCIDLHAGKAWASLSDSDRGLTEFRFLFLMRRRHVLLAPSTTWCKQKAHTTQASYAVLLGNAPRTVML